MNLVCSEWVAGSSSQNIMRLLVYPNHTMGSLWSKYIIAMIL